MKVTRLMIVARGLTNRCPNCGGRTLFREGSFFDVNRSCPRCGLVIERDEGGFMGSMSLNYGVTLIFYLTPIGLLAYFGKIGATTALILAGAGALLVPVLLYRPSRSWWLMNYYLILPHHLPVNQREIAPGEDANT